MKVKNKKIIAIIMLILTLINTLPINAFAAFITDMNSDATFGVVQNSLSEYNHELHYAKYDGTTYLVFCSQFGKTSPTGKEYAYNNEFLAQYKANRPEYEKIAEMIYFGHTMKYGMGIPTTAEAKKSACATQQYVWEYVHNNIDSSIVAPSRSSWNANYMSDSIYTTWLNETESMYNQYHSQVSFNGTTNKVITGDTAVYTDANGVLAHYKAFDKTINGIRFLHENGSNELKVTANTGNGKATFNSSDYGLYELMPNGTEYSSSNMGNYIYFQFTSGSVQDLIFSNYIDPSHFSFSVEVESGKVQIKKLNNLGNPIAGCKFELYTDEACTNKIDSGTSASDGTILFENLKPGKFFVKEVSVVAGYLIDNTVKSVNVEAGKTATVEFKNNEPTGEIYIYKVSENGDKVGGAKFKIVAEENIYNVAKTKQYYSKGQEVDIITTDSKTGIASKTNLPLGKYKIFECEAPSRIFIK